MGWLGVIIGIVLAIVIIAIVIVIFSKFSKKKCSKKGKLGHKNPKCRKSSSKHLPSKKK